MNKNAPNDSILLPEGVVEDDVKVLWLNRAFTDIVDGELLEEENKDKKED